MSILFKPFSVNTRHSHLCWHMSQYPIDINSAFCPPCPHPSNIAVFFVVPLFSWYITYNSLNFNVNYMRQHEFNYLWCLLKFSCGNPAYQILFFCVMTLQYWWTGLHVHGTLWVWIQLLPVSKLCQWPKSRFRISFFLLCKTN